MKDLLRLKSSTFKSFYGEYPNDYDIKFMHFGIEIENDEEEYKFINEDLKNIKHFSGDDLFKLYFSTVHNLIEFLDNISLPQEYLKFIYLRIRDNKDIEALNKLGSEINLVIDINDLVQLDFLRNYNFDITVQVDSITQLSANDLDNLIKDGFNITKVCVGQISHCSTEEYWLSYLDEQNDKLNMGEQIEDYFAVEKQVVLSNDIYLVSDYCNIENKIAELVESAGICADDDEATRFKKVYDVIVNAIKYAHDTLDSDLLENQTLYGGLFLNQCVCEGFAKTLQQAMAYIGIESIVVGGGSSKEEGGHIWNQVKINNIWYNCDAAVDSINIANGNKISCCLVSDEELLYKTDSVIAKKCDATFDFKLVSSCSK